jgi:hypothetical protein
VNCGFGVCEFVVFFRFEECPPIETLLFSVNCGAFGYVGLWGFLSFFFLGICDCGHVCRGV